jgi:class 3 adenylate cyclase
VTVSKLLDPLDAARDASVRGAWRAAYSTYGELDDTALEPRDLETYGEAAWWSGKLDEAIATRERAYAAYTATGDPLGAARMAITLAWDYEGRGAFAVSNGWLATAERLLADTPEAPEHGRLLLTRALMTLFAEGDIERATALFDEAYEVARRVGDRDVQMLALGGKGRAAIKAGDTERGLALLDEASASAMGGNLRPHAAGLVYCITISACQDLGDFRRAAEWTEAANRMCDQLDVTGFPGACRIHRAEALRLRGDWPAAEAQAVAACEELSDFDRSITASGYYEIGEIRRRRGDFAGAEEAYRTSNELGREPQPGLALLRLAEGKVDAAVAGVSSSLREAGDPLFRLRRLPAQVEISVAAGDLRTARAAAEEMEEIVDAYKIGDRRTLAFDATVHVAWGRIQIAERDWEGAVRCLRRARDEWKEVGAPYETAQARMLLGIALRRQGDEHAAEAELEGALAAFEKLGASRDEARVRELLGRVAARRTFLFTDIVDSTKLLETLGDDKWRRLLSRHDEILREGITVAGGEIVKKTGDGFFASFESPRAAVEAAVAIQRALDAEIVAPDVRIGAHAGDAFRAGEDTSDYGGQSVHVAARIGGAASGREILVSTETLDGIHSSFRASEPRPLELKGVTEPVEVVSIDWR